MMRRKRRSYRRKAGPQPLSIPPKPKDARRLAPTDVATAYGNFSRRQMYRLIAKGKIKAYKDGPKTLIDLNTVDAYHASLPELNHAHG